METVINLEETPGHWVGRKQGPDPLKVRPGERADARKSRRIYGPIAPKGVYRFHTHEEADAWLIKMIARRKS